MIDFAGPVVSGTQGLYVIPQQLLPAAGYGADGTGEACLCRRVEEPMEFLNLVIMFITAYLVLRKPQKERLAFRLLVVSVVLMVALFSFATRTALLPGVNY